MTAVGLATMVISDGDEMEVDGTTGEVTMLRRAPEEGPSAAGSIAGSH